MEFVTKENVYIYNEFVFNNGQSMESLRILKDFLKIRHMKGIVDKKTVSSLVSAIMNAYIPLNLENHFNNSEKVIDYITLLQKDLYFNQKIINTEVEVDELFDEFSKLEFHLFRGLSEAKYALYSTLQREWINKKLFLKHSSYSSYLMQLVNTAREIDEGILYKYLTQTGFNANNDLSILSFLQHYGCPTPLIDWTYNFKVALYFATHKRKETTANKYIDKYFSIYFLDQKYFDDISINRDVYRSIDNNMEFLKTTFASKLKSFNIDIRKIKIDDKTIKELALNNVTPNQNMEFSKIENMMRLPTSYLSEIHADYPLPNYLQNSLHIMSQEGVFTWNNDAFLPFEAAVKRDNLKSKDHEGNMIAGCVNINKSLKEYILNKLKVSGINKNTIYPSPKYLAKKVFKNT